MRRFFHTLTVLLWIGATPPARADGPVTAPQTGSGTSLAERIDALEKALAEERARSEERIRALEKEIADLKTASVPAPAPAPVPPAPGTVVSPPILSGAGGRNFLNLSLDALVSAGTSTTEEVERLQTGGHDPAQRGFTVQSVEMVLDGAVDPYFRGQANLVWQTDANGESVVELEEVYATTSSLPKGLQVKAGQYLTEFGRLNPTHPHTWDFVDQPLAIGRMFGGDGLRAPGARLSWLVPSKFYQEVLLSIQDSGGETLPGFRSVEGEMYLGREIRDTSVGSLSDLLYVPRWTASFDLGDTKTVLVGASAAFGPNGTGEDARTRILALDFFYKWKAATASKGFPFLKLQAEGLWRRYEADPTDALPGTVFHDWGAYAQLSWGWKPMWVLGLRAERVAGDTGDPEDPYFLPRWRASPAVTWFPTEYSKLRLQYNYDDMDSFGPDHSLWLQLEFLLGAHAAHKF